MQQGLGYMNEKQLSAIRWKAVKIQSSRRQISLRYTDCIRWLLI